MDGEVSLADFIDVKGWKALGNRLSDQKLTGVKEIISTTVEPENNAQDDSQFNEIEEDNNSDTPSVSDVKNDENGKYQAGDTIEFDFD